MVISDLDIIGAGFGPAKANPPLAINSYGVIAQPFFLFRKLFQAVAWRNPEIAEDGSSIKLCQFFVGLPGNRGEFGRGFPFPERFSLLASEALDRHSLQWYRLTLVPRRETCPVSRRNASLVQYLDPPWSARDPAPISAGTGCRH